MVETEVTVGAVVSVVEDELSKESSEELSDDEEELSVLAVLLSSLLLQEKTVRLKKVYENYVKNFIHLFPSPVMRENKFEKSHIHIMNSETLSREFRITESTKECQFNSLRLHTVHLFLPVVNAFILFVERKEEGRG